VLNDSSPSRRPTACGDATTPRCAGAGSGFTILNDLAVAAAYVRKHEGVSRVAVVDLDVHQGDGTATLFEGDGSVFTLSMHCGANFPFRKARSDLDIDVPSGVPATRPAAAGAPRAASQLPPRVGTADAGYLRLLRETLPTMLRRFRPELAPPWRRGSEPQAGVRLTRPVARPSRCCTTRASTCGRATGSATSSCRTPASGAATGTSSRRVCAAASPSRASSAAGTTEIHWRWRGGTHCSIAQPRGCGAGLRASPAVRLRRCLSKGLRPGETPGERGAGSLRRRRATELEGRV